MIICEGRLGIYVPSMKSFRTSLEALCYCNVWLLHVVFEVFFSGCIIVTQGPNLGNRMLILMTSTRKELRNNSRG